MRVSYTAALAAAALAVPAVTRAQSSALEPPAGYFAGLTRSWTLSGCATGTIGRDPDGVRPLYGQAFCVDGRATLGRTTSGGYQLLLAFTQASPPNVVSAGNVYSLSPFSSDVSFTLGAACAAALPACSGGGTLVTDVPGYYHPEFFSIGYATSGAFDFATFAVGPVNYVTSTRVPTYPSATGEYTTARLTATLAPEPATLALTLGGLAVLGGAAAARRRPPMCHQMLPPYGPARASAP